MTLTRIPLNDYGQLAAIVQNALPQNAIIANCNMTAMRNIYNYLI